MPEPAQIASAPIGVFPMNYRELIKLNFADLLLDPSEATYDFKYEPRRGSMGSIGGSWTKIGWITCGTLSARYRFEGYVSFRPFVAVVSNGIVTDRQIGTYEAERCATGGFLEISQSQSSRLN
jgi:hypothetical protein